MLFLPTAKVIREALPDAALDLVTSRGAPLELARSTPYFDHVYAKDVRELLRLRRGQYDYCLVAYPSLLRPHLLARLVNARRVVGHQYDLGWFGMRSFFCNVVINDSPSDHFLDRNLGLAQALGIEVADVDRKPVFPLPLEAVQYAEAFLEGKEPAQHHLLVGLHPGSGARMAAKRWPHERYAELAHLIAEELGAQVIVFAGPDERNVAQRLLEAVPRSVKLHTGGTFLQAAAVVGRCHLFIANDTALMHAATALEVPTIALFGPTDLGQTGPYGPGHVVLRKPLPCSPCYKLTDYDVRCPIAYECMRLITVEEVLAQARRMVSVSALERRLT